MDDHLLVRARATVSKGFCSCKRMITFIDLPESYKIKGDRVENRFRLEKVLISSSGLEVH